MYKVASDRRQVSLHRGRVTDWVNGEERQTDQQKLVQAQDGIRILDARIQACTDKDERRQLGLQKLELQNEAGRLRKLVNGERRLKEGLSNYIVDAAKDILSKSQFDLIYRSGHRRYEEAQREIEKLRSDD